jgi:mannose-1-phosphate guanylyltransferase/mannose-6-phosphate isomerase
MPVHPIILCGGSGTRLWPVSRKAYPKQFAPLLGRTSLYQMTLARFAAEGFAAPLVMTGDAFRFLATDQAADLGLRDARVVVEPVGRDTAPAILTAALMLEDTPEALMLVAPSDHVIGDVEAFRGAVLRKGAEAARTGAFVTFGVTLRPSRDGIWLPAARRHARERRGGAAEKLPREARPRDRAGDAEARAATCGTRASS